MAASLPDCPYSYTACVRFFWPQPWVAERGGPLHCTCTVGQRGNEILSPIIRPLSRPTRRRFWSPRSVSAPARWRSLFIPMQTRIWTFLILTQSTALQRGGEPGSNLSRTNCSKKGQCNVIIRLSQFPPLLHQTPRKAPNARCPLKPFFWGHIAFAAFLGELCQPLYYSTT